MVKAILTESDINLSDEFLELIVDKVLLHMNLQYFCCDIHIHSHIEF